MKIKLVKKVKRPLVRPCPCAVGYVSCNYVVISHILGCPYNCSYCFLHTFYGKDEIVVYDNEESILAQVSGYMRKAEEPLRIGTGQYSDSLALDRKTGLSKKLIELFAGQDKHLLELKTKSAEVDHLLDLDHKGRTVFAWSVNPEEVVKNEEVGAATLGQRIKAAEKCAAAGYPVAFHFDPIIYPHTKNFGVGMYPGWEEDYKGVVELIFSRIDPEGIAWISLGALRFAPELKQKFPRSRITQGEMDMGEDGKMRYPEQKRIEIFKRMQEFIRPRSAGVFVYLCMESAKIWEEVGVENKENDRFARFFRFFQKQ
jgi:spore photoproduct lyase